MDSLERLGILSEKMELEPAEDLGCPKISSTHQSIKLRHEPLVSEAIMPNGKRMRLLKTLLTSACERNCYYCPFRAGRDFRRATLKPDEMAHVFTGMFAAGLVQGMFLSSGIAGGGVRAVVEAAGIRDVLAKSLGSSNHANVVKATIAALRSLRRRDEILKVRGIKTDGKAEQQT